MIETTIKQTLKAVSFKSLFSGKIRRSLDNETVTFTSAVTGEKATTCDGDFYKKYLFVGYCGNSYALSGWATSLIGDKSVTAFYDKDWRQSREHLWLIHQHKEELFTQRPNGRLRMNLDADLVTNKIVTRDDLIVYLNLYNFTGSRVVYLSRHDEQMANLFIRFIEYLRG